MDDSTSSTVAVSRGGVVGEVARRVGVVVMDGGGGGGGGE